MSRRCESGAHGAESQLLPKVATAEPTSVFNHVAEVWDGVDYLTTTTVLAGN